MRRHLRWWSKQVAPIGVFDWRVEAWARWYWFTDHLPRRRAGSNTNGEGR